MRSRLNSRSSRSWMISRCSRPRKPQRKPKPSAALVSASKWKRGVVEAQLGERLAQLLELGGIDREQAAEHHRHAGLEAGQHLGRGLAVVGDRVADLAVGDGLDAGDDEADLARAQLGHVGGLGREDADLVEVVAPRPPPSCGSSGPCFSTPSFTRTSVTTPRYGSYQLSTSSAFSGASRSPLGAGRRLTMASSTSSMPRPVLAETMTASDVSMPITSSISLHTRSGSADGQVDLVQDRDDLVVRFDRVIGVGQRLRLDALAGIDHQQRALAGGQRAADLVGEVDMAGRVHQVQDVGLAVLGLVVEAHGLRLDGDAALALDIHRIEHLVVELALAHRAAGASAAGRPACSCHGRYGR